jgi:hypothetical protein
VPSDPKPELVDAGVVVLALASLVPQRGAVAIGTSDALVKLQIIATSSDSVVAGYAQKRIDSWEAERDRKGR